MAGDSIPSSSRIRKPPLTQERLKELLRYDPITGFWTRLTSNSGKGYVAGYRAGTKKAHGYRTIDIDGSRYYEHRLAVFYMTGEWPAGRIDHRNNVERSNNAWNNLRPATPTQNNANRAINKTSTTGFKGVGRHINPNRRKRFCARIKIDRHSIHLGWFETPEEAHAAYAARAREIYGEFARTA